MIFLGRTGQFFSQLSDGTSENLVQFRALDQTISKWLFSGHFEFCNIYLTEEMQNDWTMNIEQNAMSHTRITHDKFHTKKSKIAASQPFFFFFFLLSRKSCMIADLRISASSYFT